MNATLTKQFEGFAECCLELARSAETTERRARFIQMADEYRLATLLTSEELSSGPKSRRLLPAAESPPLIAAEAPASRAQTRPQTRLFARSAAPRHPGFKAQMFDADKQNRDLSNRDQGGNATPPSLPSVAALPEAGTRTGKTAFAAPGAVQPHDGRAVKGGLFYVRRHTCADGSFEWYVLNGHTRRPASKLFRTRAAAAAERARLQVKLELAKEQVLKRTP